MLTKYHNKLDEIVNAAIPYMIGQNKDYWAKDVKDKFAELIKEWAADDGIKVNVRFEGVRLISKISLEKELRDYPFVRGRQNTPGLKVDNVAIFNNVGGLDKKSLWLNKISIVFDNGGFRVRSHKARTDPNFLSPLDTRFLEFFDESFKYINEKLKQY